MSRAAPKWLHQICVRDFGHELSPTEKLFLHTINTFCDDSAECFPGQETIAKGASLGVSTVRRVTASTSKKGWVALYDRGSTGKKWKSYFYRLCVPDWINLADIAVKDSDAERLVSHFESQHGGIDDDNVSGTLHPQQGRKRAPPNAGGSSGQAPPDNDNKHRPITTQAPPDNDTNDRPLRGGKSQVLSSNEVPKEEARNSEDRITSTPLGLNGKSKTQRPEPPRKKEVLSNFHLWEKLMNIAPLVKRSIPDAVKELEPYYHDITPHRIGLVLAEFRHKRASKSVPDFPVV